jgi:hypothetical protein
MGKDSAARSQMDVRVALRVRERRDVDLIIGQGSLNAGWDARQLTKPGEFLLSDPEHHTPDTSRAYLLTDDRIASHAAACARLRPALPPGTPDTPRKAPEPPQDNRIPNVRDDDRDAAEAALCAALRAAGPRGATVGELMAACGMRRSWVYYRLMMTRRSLPGMSAVDGVALLRYQGARARCSSTPAGSWPAVAYQVMASAWRVSWNGTVRRTALAVRLRAWPAPSSCLASSIATSMLHLAA